MAVLEGPVKRHTLGRRPSHSSTVNLADNFEHIGSDGLLRLLISGGYMGDSGKPTRRALDEGLLDSCGRKVLWNLGRVGGFLESCGVNPQRCSVNQEVRSPAGGGPSWVNLGTVGTYFSVSARTVGLWLDELGLRDANGLGSPKAQDMGLSTVVEMSAGGDRTRKVALWDLYGVQRVLLEAGHELDFDYESTLKGRGRNSDVVVSEDMDGRVRSFVEQFMREFRDPVHRYRCVRLVKQTPTPVLRQAEVMMGRPGFLVGGRFKEYVRYK